MWIKFRFIVMSHKLATVSFNNQMKRSGCLLTAYCSTALIACCFLVQQYLAATPYQTTFLSSHNFFLGALSIEYQYNVRLTKSVLRWCLNNSMLKNVYSSPTLARITLGILQPAFSFLPTRPQSTFTWTDVATPHILLPLFFFSNNTFLQCQPIIISTTLIKPGLFSCFRSKDEEPDSTPCHSSIRLISRLRLLG